MKMRSLGAGIPEREDVLLPQTTRKGDRKSEGLWQMVKKRFCDRIAGRIASAAAKTGRLKAVLVVAATVGVLSVTAYVSHKHSVPASPQPPAPMQGDTETEAARPTDDGGSSLLGEAPIVGRLMAQTDPNKISAPSVGISFGRRPGAADGPDLSTPATAVHEVLALIDRGATDQLSQCFAKRAEDVASGLYPRYLGRPVELVEVAEEGAAARVFWKATVHTGFTLEGRNWSPGETITLETRLVYGEGVWKLARLYEHRP